MKLLLINPATKRYTRTPCTPLGILSIGSYLKKNGHEVMILNRSVRSDNIQKTLDSFRPDVIGCSLISTMSITDSVYISKLAKKRNIPVIWGGPIVSSSAEIFAAQPYVDAVSVGEGEAAWLDIANAVNNGEDILSVPGLAYYKDGEYIYHERDFMDLTLLPPTDYSLLDVAPTLFTDYDTGKYKKVMPVYLSKGCTGHCTFCYNTDFHKNCRRQKDLNVFLQDIDYLKSTDLGVDALFFTDELFGGTKENTRNICRAFLEHDMGLPWGGMTRIGIYDKEDFDLLYKAGCRWLEFGIESGAPSTLKRMKKGMNPERAVIDINNCKAAGINPLCYFIVGFPGETEDELKKTCELADRIGFARFICSYFSPLPGSEIYEQLVKEKKLTPIENMEDFLKPQSKYSPAPNLSSVKTKDLKVIRCSMLWASFSKKYFSGNDDKYPIAVSNILTIIRSLFGHGPIKAVYQLFVSGHEFLDIFFYSHFFPSTKKKYGLTLK